MLLSHTEAVQALSAGYVLLVSRCAFSSLEEIRQNYPPHGDEHIWAEKAKDWYQKRRHVYVICTHPEEPSQYVTSTSEPDKTSNPWTLQFCSPTATTTKLDVRALISESTWHQYNTAAILLPKETYPNSKIITHIEFFRLNQKKPIYDIEPNGYDCQTATRDVLQATNLDINANELILPPQTDILAYRSTQSIL